MTEFGNAGESALHRVADKNGDISLLSKTREDI